MPEPSSPEPEPPAPEPEPEPEPPEPEPQAPEPEPRAPAPEVERAPVPAPPAPPAPFPGPAPRLEGESPEQRRRATATALLERRRDAGGKAPRAKGRGPLRMIALAVLVLVVGVIGWLALSLFQPFKGDGDGSVEVRIPTGASVSQIADLLEDRGVVSSAFFFQARATVSGRRDDFKAGRFTLKRGMSHTAAMDLISEGPPADVVRVSVPEGRSRREIDRIVGNRLRGDYITGTRRSAQLDPRRYGAPRGATLEGFLFPATYELKKGSRTSQLVSQQLAQFKRNFAGVDQAFAKRRKLSAYDILTIASMIDREASVARERPIIASVIYNRLREGIPLGIDATIRYATNNWSRPLTQSQLAIDSPYNTRTRKGLPPGPIGSPGLAAIKAAARPARTQFLFYVVKPGTCGEHAFTKTDAEFQRDVERYNRERARRGGKSPTRC